MTSLTSLQRCCSAVLAALLWPACTPPFATTFERDNTTVSLALLPEDRFAMVRAVDMLLFDANQFSCATLLRSSLDDPNLRVRAASNQPERVRLCSDAPTNPDNPMFQLLGRVSEGRKSILVTASYLDHECRVFAEGDGPEVNDPGLVVGAGCEEADVRGGKITRTRVVVFPFRDPSP